MYSKKIITGFALAFAMTVSAPALAAQGGMSPNKVTATDYGVDRMVENIDVRQRIEATEPSVFAAERATNWQANAESNIDVRQRVEATEPEVFVANDRPGGAFEGPGDNENNLGVDQRRQDTAPATLPEEGPDAREHSERHKYDRYDSDGRLGS